MFKVRDLRNGEVRTVYAISGMFLLLFVDGEWCWDSWEFYVPVEVEDA